MMELMDEVIEAVCDLDDPKFNNVSIKVAATNLPISFDADLYSKSLGKGIKLMLKTAFRMVMDKEGLEDIWN